MKTRIRLFLVFFLALGLANISQADATEPVSTGSSVKYEIVHVNTAHNPVEKRAASGPHDLSPRPQKRFPVETPSQAKARIDLSEKFAEMKKRTASPADVLGPGLDYCRTDPAAADLGGHPIDHQDFCQADRLSLLKKVCPTDPAEGECKIVGQVDFSVTTVGAPKAGKRQVEFITYLDNFVTVIGDMSEDVLRVDMMCKPSKGESCGPIPGNVNGAGSTVAAWQINGETYFGFDSPTTGVTTGPDLISWYTFDIWFTLNGRETLVEQGNDFRCDSATYFAYANGCVFDSSVDIWTLVANPEVKQTAAHIEMAQTNPNATVPSVPGKKVPGNPFASGSSPVFRVKSSDPLYNANRSRARTECRRAWGGNYSQAGKFDCDEYPFASTYQGGASGPDPQPKNFSVRVINSADNQEAGRRLGNFYNDHRILDSDPFWVTVSLDSTGTPLPALPAPPVHPSNGGDMNNDGRPDVVAAGKDGQLWFYAGLGDGKLAAKKNIGTSGWSNLMISHRGDWTGDGNEDLLVRYPSNGQAYVYPGKGDGTIGSRIPLKGLPAFEDPALPYRSFVSVGDLTNKGYPDAIEVYVYKDIQALDLNVGDPSNKPGVSGVKNLGEGGWASYTLMAPGDADYSGRVDLLARNTGTGVLYFYPGTTAGALGSRTVYGSSGWTAQNRPLIASGNDANSDGLPDLWATTPDGQLLFYSGGYDGSGHPVDGPSTVVGTAGWSAMASLS